MSPVQNLMSCLPSTPLPGPLCLPASSTVAWPTPSDGSSRCVTGEGVASSWPSGRGTDQRRTLGSPRGTSSIPHSSDSSSGSILTWPRGTAGVAHRGGGYCQDPCFRPVIVSVLFRFPSVSRMRVTSRNPSVRNCML